MVKPEKWHEFQSARLSPGPDTARADQFEPVQIARRLQARDEHAAGHLHLAAASLASGKPSEHVRIEAVAESLQRADDVRVGVTTAAEAEQFPRRPPGQRADQQRRYLLVEGPRGMVLRRDGRIGSGHGPPKAALTIPPPLLLRGRRGDPDADRSMEPD
jgi:hypothetical protein